MSYIKRHIEELLEQGIDVLHPEHQIDEINHYQLNKYYNHVKKNN